ncbi:MAG: glycosyltransferase family 39 protein, partial [Aerococcus sp.]|nr:glycosyltransferase family 39 protein [Aerococcus sp.]
MTFIVSLTWAENPFSQSVSGHDSSIFIYIGKAITQGYRPYLDVTDHKGPVIFLLNALGWKLPHVHPSGGIYFITFAFFLAFLVIVYKTARLWVSRIPALLAPLFTSVAISAFTEDGNLTELYALPFISLILFYFIVHFKRGNLPDYSYYLMGFGTLFVFGLRANMIVALAPIFVVLLISIGLKNHHWQTIIPPLTKLIIGGLIFLIPLCIYLIATGTLMASINDSIFTNMLYLNGDRSQLSAIITHVKALNSYGLITAMLIASGLLIVTTKNKKENWLLIGMNCTLSSRHQNTKNNLTK